MLDVPRPGYLRRLPALAFQSDSQLATEGPGLGQTYADSWSVENLRHRHAEVSIGEELYAPEAEDYDDPIVASVGAGSPGVEELVAHQSAQTVQKTRRQRRAASETFSGFRSQARTLNGSEQTMTVQVSSGSGQHGWSAGEEGQISQHRGGRARGSHLPERDRKHANAVRRRRSCFRCRILRVKVRSVSNAALHMSSNIVN
jgi:hypothetical protein